MKKQFTTLAAVAALSLIIASSAVAQTTVAARVGTDTAAYHFVEVIQQYDNDALTGAGYIGTIGNPVGDPREGREAYAGAGRVFRIAGANILAIGFVDQTGGTNTDAQTSVVPWLLATRTFGSVISTANYFVYAPVGDGETVQVLEHAKAEHAIGTRWLAGIGYAGTKVSDGPWTHKPFVTATRKTSIGSFEVWLQRPSAGNSTVQLRYLRAF